MRAASVLLAIALSLGALSARADDAKVESRRAFDDGARALENGRAKEALELFQKAYALYPHFATLYNIGLCERALGHPTRAARAFHQHLNQGGAQIAAADRARVAALLDEVEKKEARVTLHVTPAATLKLDGEVVSDGLVLADPGDHVLEAEAAAHVAGRKTFSVQAGAATTLELELAPVHDEPRPSPPPLAAAPERFNRAFWTLSIVAAGAAVAGTVSGVVALGDARAYNDLATPDAEADRRRSQGQVLRVIADVSFATAIGTAIGAVIVGARTIKPVVGARSVGFTATF